MSEWRRYLMYRLCSSGAIMPVVSNFVVILINILPNLFYCSFTSSLLSFSPAVAWVKNVQKIKKKLFFGEKYRIKISHSIRCKKLIEVTSSLNYKDAIGDSHSIFPWINMNILLNTFSRICSRQKCSNIIFWTTGS